MNAAAELPSPRRIVSLVPSLTETVATVGLEREIVGCTTFCCEPPDLARKVSLIGGTKDPQLENILKLQPTHILVNTEENNAEHISWLKSRVPTLECFPKSPRDVPALLHEMGAFLKAEDNFSPWEQKILRLLQQFPVSDNPRSYLYLIWREPYMLAGKDCYISNLLELMGLKNAAANLDSQRPGQTLGQRRYPRVTVEEMVAASCDMVLFSSEPYPFRIRDMKRLLQQWPDNTPNPEFRKIDGQLCSWYGTKTADALIASQMWLSGETSSLIGSAMTLS